MFRKWLALALALTLLCGCVAFATAEDVKNIQIWVGGETDAEHAVYESMFAEIDERHPEFTITLINQGNQETLADQLTAAALSGDLPDITLADGSLLASYTFPGMLLPIDDYMTDEIKANLIPSVIAEGTDLDGKLYMVGQFDSCLTFWANKSYLEQAGVRIPTSPEDAWTKEEFEDALTKLKTVCEWPLDMNQQYLVSLPSYFYYAYLPFVASFGGDWINAETNLSEGALNSDGTVAAFEYFRWLSEQDYLNAAQDYGDGFYNKKESALYLAGHWMKGTLQETLGEDALLVPLPNFGAGVYTTVASTTWAMTTGAEAHGTQDMCGAILTEMLSDSYVEAICRANGAIPALKSVFDKMEDFQVGGILNMYRQMHEGGYIHNRPVTPAASFMQTEIGRRLSNVMNGADAKTELDAAVAEVDQLIMDNNYAQ